VLICERPGVPWAHLNMGGPQSAGLSGSQSPFTPAHTHSATAAPRTPQRRTAGRGSLGLGRTAPSRTIRTGGIRDHGRFAAAVPEPGAAATARGAARAGDGLSGTERRALQAIAAGAASPAAAVRAAQDLEAAPFLSDTWFYRTLTDLGSGQARPIETQAGDPLRIPRRWATPTPSPRRHSR